MLIPLPVNLDSRLDELGQCGSYVEDSQYTDSEREEMKQLQTLGLATVGWVLTPAGRRRLNAIADGTRPGD